MNNIVYRTLCEKCGLSDKERIIVALSGGADSSALFHVLLKIRNEYGNIEVFAAHVNHNLRGEESQRDEDFVRNLCESKGVQLFVLSEDVAALSQEKGQSVELCAREVRYDFFSELSKKLSAKVATAHTLSDSEETMIYNICRGSSLHGLCSIPYKRDCIIRPLLDVTRQQVEEYCKENNVSFVQDSTNMDEDMCKRNKIRLAVIPNLKNINEGFEKNFYRLRENLLQTDDFMNQQAEDALESARCEFGFSASMLCFNHTAVIRYALALLIRKAGVEPDFNRITLCEEILKNGGAVEISQNVFAICKQGIFRIANESENFAELEITFGANTEFVFSGKKYTAKILDKNSIVNKKLASFCIGYDKIGDDVLIRTRKSGDTFMPLLRGVRKSLRKLQNELKIPSEKRDTSLVVAKGNVVLWAEYIGVSADGLMEGTDTQGVYIETEDI
ncbi:MAG: tRNA lysidine(34) synthetase TilS [Ruminococcaceae bacterium]|nr:tRNA lysidine(34) synthetase TilS [Oscillospiraceae bacterium]